MRTSGTEKPEESADEFNSDFGGRDTTHPHIVNIQPIRDPEDEPYVFRFELGPAILQQLLVKLESLAAQPLTDAVVKARHPGFYQLILDGKPVYIGKTSRTISARLKEHLNKLRGRIVPERMMCRFAYVEDPSLVDISEGALIRFFDQLDAAEWNHTGFGSKVTGYRRGQQRRSIWATEFPPDLKWPVTAGGSSEVKLSRIITSIAGQAPITLSIPRDFKAEFDPDHPAPLNLPKGTRPVQEWIVWVEERLAKGWRVQRTNTGWYIVK